MADQTGDIPCLVQLLSSSSAAVQEAAAGALYNLAFDDDNTAAIPEAGGIAPLVRLLDSSNLAVQQAAAGALQILARNDDNKTAIAAAGGIAPLVELLDSSSAAVREHAGVVLRTLAYNSSNNQAAVAFAAGIERLVRMLDSSSEGVQEVAAWSLARLAYNRSNQAAIAEAGGIVRLVRLLNSSSAAVQGVAAQVLLLMACNNSSNKAAIVAADGIAPLVWLLNSSSVTVQEQAGWVLANLASENSSNKAAIVNAGGIAPLLRLLDSSSVAMQELAAGALVLLAYNSSSQAAIADAGGIVPLVRLLDSSSVAVQAMAAQALRCLACEGNNEAAFAAAGGIVPLVRLLDSSSVPAQEQAAAALANLAGKVQCATSIVSYGGIAGLERLLDSPHANVWRQAGRALALLNGAQHTGQQRHADSHPTASRHEPGAHEPPTEAAARQPPSPHNDPLPHVTEQLSNVPSGTLEGAGSGSADALSPWEVRYEELTMGHLLGRGSFSEVFYARWRHSPVAVKILRGGGLEQSSSLSSPLLRSLRKEASLMMRLRHPNCVNVMGICTSPAAIITEYCERGCLTDVYEHAAANPGEAAQLHWSRRLAMALDCARGIWYLHSHSPPIVHRDLKSANLLVDSAWRVKVADFNLSKVLEDANRRSTVAMNANPRWQAPEVLSGACATPAADVFAFGQVLYELLTWQLPWHNVPANLTWQIASKVVAGKRLPVPHRNALPGPDTQQFGGLDAYIALMQVCWAHDPAARPTFDAIIPQLEGLMPAAAPPSAPADPPRPGMDTSAGPSQPAQGTRECRICYRDFPSAQFVVLVPCGHRQSCESCTLKILQRDRRCPICRAEIKSAAPGDFRVYS